jgi:hypothetical protein
MKNKETLEEVAERLKVGWKIDRPSDFIEGAKWQQEQDKNKYSEEEVLEILEHHTKYLETFIYQYIDKNDMEENKIWSNQFKKK